MKNLKVVMCRGLPGSGKSTWTKEFIEKNSNFRRWNRDDARMAFDGGKYSKDKERSIKELRNFFIERSLFLGFSVIVDDCCLDKSNEEAIRPIAELNGAAFEIKFFDVPLSECLRRNALRPNPVPDHVIIKMHDRYLKKEQSHPVYYPLSSVLPNCWVFDVDGTLALRGDRGIFDHEQCHLDAPNMPVVKMAQYLIDRGAQIFVVSGRMDNSYPQTSKWLTQNGVYYHDLYMRKTGDQRKDSTVKEEIWREHFKDKWNILGWWDDRNQVVEHLRELGLPIWQVQNGNF
jgi:predicted kinase